MKNLLFGLIFAAVGVGVGVYGLNEYKKAKASTTWPSVKGRILDSSVHRSTSHSTSSGRTRNKTTYKARVSYTYAIKGKSFTSKRISFSAFTAVLPICLIWRSSLSLPTSSAIRRAAWLKRVKLYNDWVTESCSSRASRFRSWLAGSSSREY